MKQDLEVFWNKKSFCYFILSIMVMAIHTVGTDFYSDQIEIGNINYNIINLFKLDFTSGAVPLYFIISAILFFRNVGTFKNSIAKSIKHLKTLIVPFLIWNLIGVAFNLLIFNIPFVAQYIKVREGIGLNFKDIFEGIFFYKYNQIYWYIAQLFIFVILSPLINLILKNKIASFLFLIGLFLLNIFHIRLPFLIFSNDSFIYYFMGAIIGKYYFDLFKETEYSRRTILISAVLMFISVIANSILGNTVYRPILNSVIALSLWVLIQVFEPIYRDNKLKFIGFSFFAFSCHYYFEPCISKIILNILPINIFSMYVNNIFALVITIFLSYGFGYLLYKYIPKLYGVLTGSR